MTDAKITKKTVILKPRMTEKAALKTNAQNVYVFNVTAEATKSSVIGSIKAEYKVTPIGVRLLAIPAKKVFRRGKSGIKGGGKKAYVYLKKGDKITTS